MSIDSAWSISNISKLYFVFIPFNTVKGRKEQLMCLSIIPLRRIEGLDTKLHTFLISAEWPVSGFSYFTHSKCVSVSVE